MNRSLLIFFACSLMFFNPGILKAQDIYTIQGKIVDSSSNEGIEYVCVGIIGKDVGTIANEMGFYNLKIPGQFINDKITLSRIGYQTKVVIVKDFINQNNDSIVLTPKNTELTEVAVTDKSARAKTRGNITRSVSIVMSISSGSVGSEVGTVIHLPNDSVLIKDLNFHITSDNPDSVKFRLNIYRFNKEIEDNILSKSIYFTVANNYTGDFKVDLVKYHLCMGGKIFISVEPLAVFSKGPRAGKDTYYDRINISGSITGSKSFYRKVSLGKWKKIPYSFSAGLWITYLD